MYANGPEKIYAINGVKYNADEVVNNETTLVSAIEKGFVEVSAPTGELDTEYAVYLREDRVLQKNLETDITKQAQTFVIDQFNPITPGMV
jgi:hypothetical protein